ncbi:MAG: hypothetical protein QUV05_01660 [Phycisphaerae bacterium]|nr:hypothetical protein [Phycisphaerae bacterium]
MKRSTAVSMIVGTIGALVCGCTPAPPGEWPGEDTLIIFDNGSGPMCLDALAWLETMQTEHPDLVVQEYLTTNPANVSILADLKLQHGQSQGVSTTFQYLPIIFYRGQAFSGFNDEVEQTLGTLIESAETPAT